MSQREAIDGFICISPWLLGLLVFTLGPFVVSFVLSFFRWNMIRPPVFVGVANYRELFTDQFVRYATKATVYYAGLSVPAGLLGGLAVALLMNLNLRGQSIYRTLIYSPAVVSGVATAMLWIWLLDAEAGLINSALRTIGIRGPAWLADERWAVPSLVLVNLWGVGGGMLVLLGALQNVPTTLYDAAKVDGAGAFRRFWHVTVPMISPILLFNLVTGFIGAMQAFTNAYVMTSGGPHYATMFYVLYLYRSAFVDFRMGYASALAWLLFIIIMALTLVILRSSTVWVYYEGLRVGTARRRGG
jgi:multiple sugar transport system permease protein